MTTLTPNATPTTRSRRTTPTNEVSYESVCTLQLELTQRTDHTRWTQHIVFRRRVWCRVKINSSARVPDMFALLDTLYRSVSSLERRYRWGEPPQRLLHNLVRLVGGHLNNHSEKTRRNPCGYSGRTCPRINLNNRKVSPEAKTQGHVVFTRRC